MRPTALLQRRVPSTPMGRAPQQCFPPNLADEQSQVFVSAGSPAELRTAISICDIGKDSYARPGRSALAFFLPVSAGSFLLGAADPSVPDGDPAQGRVEETTHREASTRGGRGGAGGARTRNNRKRSASPSLPRSLSRSLSLRRARSAPSVQRTARGNGEDQEQAGVHRQEHQQAEASEGDCQEIRAV